jgi:intraflagellar transport protein 122
MTGVVSTSSWSDLVPAKNGTPVSINDVSYSPDGSRCVIAAGNRVLLYDASNGDLIKSLRGHEGTVYTVDFSADGAHFASGGADNAVVIWKASGQGKLKYPHGAPIQRVKYNPVSFQLASCSDVSVTSRHVIICLSVFRIRFSIMLY